MIDCRALAAQIALYGTPLAALAQGLSSILIKLNPQEADDNHRRVLAVITFLKAR